MSAEAALNSRFSGVGWSSLVEPGPAVTEQMLDDGLSLASGHDVLGSAEADDGGIFHHLHAALSNCVKRWIGTLGLFKSSNPQGEISQDHAKCKIVRVDHNNGPSSDEGRS